MIKDGQRTFNLNLKVSAAEEIKKFGLKDTGYKPVYTKPKKLIQFV